MEEPCQPCKCGLFLGVMKSQKALKPKGSDRGFLFAPKSVGKIYLEVGQAEGGKKGDCLVLRQNEKGEPWGV